MLLSITGSPEFYIVLLVVAAAVVLLVSRRGSGGAVREELIGGHMIMGGADEYPRVEVDVTPGGETIVRRSGWLGMSPQAVSAKVEIKGFDITVTERVTFGGGEEVDCVEFHLPTLAPEERYHLQYVADGIGRTAAFYFRVKAGMRVVRPIGS